MLTWGTWLSRPWVPFCSSIFFDKCIDFICCSCVKLVWNWNVTSFLLMTVTMEALVTFYSPRNCSGVSQRNRIPPNVNQYIRSTWWLCTQMLEKTTKQNACPYCLCGVTQMSGRPGSPLSWSGDVNTMFLSKISAVASETGSAFMVNSGNM